MKNHAFTSISLQARIAELEVESVKLEEQMKHSAQLVLHDLKPANLIKDAFKSTIQSPGLGKNLLGGALGLAAGFLSKKIFVFGSKNIVKKAVGTVVELGVAKVVANNADKVVNKGMQLINKKVNNN
ncbi:MAG: hypothetical protein QM726_23815 [Chitinophagaceae bacterium]